MGHQDKAAEMLAGLPRSGPTAERLGQGTRARVADGMQVRVGPEMPDTLRRMAAAGQLDRSMVRAAERLMADYELAFGGGVRGVQYAERVSGGGGQGGDGAAVAVIDARARYQAKLDWLIPEVRDVVVAVVLQGAVLTAAGGMTERYTQPRRRSAVASGLLVAGLLHLARFGD